MDAKIQLEYGQMHAFDESEGESKDWQHSAARGIVAMLQDVEAINAALEAFDPATPSAFVSDLSDIIREAAVAEDETGEEVPPADMVE